MNSFTFANSPQEKIIDTQKKIAILQSDLKKFQEQEALLPKNVQERRNEALVKQEKLNALTTHTEFGFISTSGNTDTTVYSLDSKIKKGFDEHKFSFSLDAQFADDNNIETKNKFLGELEYNYEVTDRFAISYITGYKEDKFSGYNYQFYTGSGLKYKIIKEEKHDFTFEGNILYSQDSIEDTSKTLQGDKEGYTSARLKAVYQVEIFNNVSFIQDLSYRTQIEDSQNYFAFSKTALNSKISDMFSLGLNYKVDYANRPPLGKEYADKALTANLIIDY